MKTPAEKNEAWETLRKSSQTKARNHTSAGIFSSGAARSPNDTRVSWWAGALGWASLISGFLILSFGVFVFGASEQFPWVTTGLVVGSLANAGFWFSIREVLIRLREISESLKS